MTTKAIVVVPGQGDKLTAAIQDVPIPKVRDEWLIVETKAVALNPTDWKHVDYAIADVGAKIGVDYAGIVVEVGSKVSQFKKGDRVAGCCHGGTRLNHDTGSYSKYILAKASSSVKIPDNINWVEAATFPAASLTCGLGLFWHLKLALPGQTQESIPILIHGGGTTTGAWGIQFAKQCGLTVIATASPAHTEYLRSIGADHVFDYRSPTCAADIRALTNNKLQYAWDTAGGGEALCAGALSSELPSKYGSINTPNDAETLRAVNPLVEGPLMAVAYNSFGEVWQWLGKTITPNPKEVEFTIMFKEIARDMFEKGKLKAPRVSLNEGGEGLEGVLQGMDVLRKGQTKGCKLVYTM